MGKIMLPGQFNPGGIRKRLLLLALLMLCSMGLCIGCINNKDSQPADCILYENHALGFSLKLPLNWENNYMVREADHQVAFYSKKVNEKSGGGVLFTIERMTGELVTQEDMQQAPVGKQIILQGNGYTYFARMPSDVQYPPNDKALSSDYKAMAEQINNILNSAALLGNEKPKPANEGYKVVGSSFFTVEIPDNWELRAADQSPPDWPISIAGKSIGWIALIPYKSELLEDVADDNGIRAYLFDDESFREVRITLNKEYADQATMEKIKNSFKFAGGPFNVVDLQTNAEKYLAGGGKKVFGKIDGFDMKNGKPAAVRVSIMKFITDESGKEYPNGFGIEDLHKLETYPLDLGVTVAPLVAPHHNSLGFYAMPLLDENFIKNYDYKNYYYDFIFGSDGQLKIILGHYIP